LKDKECNDFIYLDVFLDLLRMLASSRKSFAFFSESKPVKDCESRPASKNRRVFLAILIA